MLTHHTVDALPFLLSVSKKLPSYGTNPQSSQTGLLAFSNESTTVGRLNREPTFGHIGIIAQYLPCESNCTFTACCIIAIAMVNDHFTIIAQV